MKRICIRMLVLSLALVTAPAWSAGALTPAELADKMEAGQTPLIIDVRSEKEFLDGHIPGARLIPHDKIGGYTESLSEHNKDPVVIYCTSGKRTQKAINKLEDAGFEQLMELEGHFPGWKEGGHPVEP